jgi:CRISPR-associated endonuclease/helicase Cas3
MAACFGDLTVTEEPLAHSARMTGMEPQTYRHHITGTVCSEGVVAGAERRANSMVLYHSDRTAGTAITSAVVDAATFHDLGKLDPDVQVALRKGREAKLRWDHIDAGVAHLRSCRANMAAWLVRAHHAPGLPSCPVHFSDPRDRHLRGRRDDTELPDRHQAQIERTDRLLPVMLALHQATVGYRQPTPGKALHGLALRLGLSCLVDADHSDTAYSETGWISPDPPRTRWPERLDALDAYVARLSNGVGQRDALRRSFYDACRDREPDQALMACEGPVGIGKTTAVTAYLLRRAMATGARRLFIVAPYTAILSQTADRLRQALVLPDERDRPDIIVAEHHHRADFGDISSRDLATLWTAPVILTTAVQFFETLSSNVPSVLRKLHALPGSVVFLDEAHATLPTHLWPQNWRWLRELVDGWSCSFVLASGSLARFWELDDVVEGACLKLLDLVPPELEVPLRKAEAARVRYVSDGHFEGPRTLAAAVMNAPGPRLLIMNTVQSAAVMAMTMRNIGHHVLHISTALCPQHRDLILAQVKARLGDRIASDWTLVATSLMEAGVDFSFCTPFRERFATTSLIQIGGRGNRNMEWPEGVTVHDFTVSAVEGLKAHPAATIPADILADLFKRGGLQGEIDHTELVTLAMKREMRRRKQVGGETLLIAEQERRYPDANRLGRVIDTDTRVVVVDSNLRDRILAHERLSATEILAGSVQIWASKIALLGVDALATRQEVYWWPHAYDPRFLGYMEGALFLQAVSSGEILIY